MNKKILIILIVLDLFWSAAALVFDWGAIGKIPVYFWPFIIICPIYPFLLAIIWYQLLRRDHTSSYLLAFAVIPSIAYFIGALIYYPTLMVSNGFNILTFGAIFWVALYGLQSFYLAAKQKIALLPMLCAILFVLVSFIIQFFTKTYDYLDTTGLDTQAIGIIYAFTFVNLVLYIIVLRKLSSVFALKAKV